MQSKRIKRKNRGKRKHKSFKQHAGQSTIIVNLSGGLGNQLFKYAAGFLQNSVSPGKMVFIFSGNIHDASNYRNTLHMEKYESHLPEDVKTINHDLFNIWNPNDYISPNIYLNGNFQNYSVLKPILPEFRKSLLHNLETQRKDMQSKYNIPKSSGFIHIRRGDYIGLINHHIQPLDYYISALTYFPNIKQWFIFSNDMDWVKQQELFRSLEPIFVKEKDPILSLALMCEIKDAAIIANSTFSWWGAYLSRGIKKVIYPKKWYNNSTPDLFPETWIGI